MALSINSRVVALKHHAFCELEEEGVILNLDTCIYYGLNEVALAVWGLVQEPIKVSEICDEIIQRFDVDPKNCENDIIELLSNLQEASLLDVTDSHRTQGCSVL